MKNNRPHTIKYTRLDGEHFDIDIIRYIILRHCCNSCTAAVRGSQTENYDLINKIILKIIT